jgi:hypothetical protein
MNGFDFNLIPFVPSNLTRGRLGDLGARADDLQVINLCQGIIFVYYFFYEDPSDEAPFFEWLVLKI